MSRRRPPEFPDHLRAYFADLLGEPVGHVVLDEQPLSEVTPDEFIAGIAVYRPDGSLLREYTAETDRAAQWGNEQRGYVIRAMLRWAGEDEWGL